MSETRTIEIPYAPQVYQKEIHYSPSRFKVVVVGRRGGKTEVLINEEIKQSVEDPGLHWIVAPTYRQVKSICWVRLKSLLKVDSDWKFNESELSAEHPKIGTRIELKGADNEESLKGVGLRSAGLDECALLKPNLWPEVIRPMLADTQGQAMFISTPKGRNWFYDLYMKGVNQEKDWQSWTHPTSINKYIQADEIAQMKLDMSERLFRQEIMAEFLDEETGVFRNVRQCIVGELKAPIEGRFYVLGADLAKTQDFTVLTVVDSVTREVVAHERFRDISWNEQKLRIQQLAKKYNNALVIIDSTGVGDPITEDLQHSNVSLYYEGDKPGYKFTNESKVRLVEQLQLSIEQRLITFPRIEALISELNEYEYTISAGGKIIYNAPEGKHDDCVISLGLANWGIRHYIHSAQVIQQQEREVIDRQGQGIPINDELETSRPYEYHGVN
jgi:hypothetical protein